jgi:alkylation response protein AidB-like acyl-CoA dehydrogenase
MSYVAPLKDMLFNIEHLARIDQVAKLPGFEDAGLETAQAVLEECAKLNQDVIAPLNWEGDKNPSVFLNGHVKTTPGFKEAFQQYGEGGWQGLQHPTAFGGQGLPKTIGAACGEMLNSANMSFALCTLLTDGAIEALLTAGSDDLKNIYLEKFSTSRINTIFFIPYAISLRTSFWQVQEGQHASISSSLSAHYWYLTRTKSKCR